MADAQSERVDQCMIDLFPLATFYELPNRTGLSQIDEHVE
jgi:hypothetical protein